MLPLEKTNADQVVAIKNALLRSSAPAGSVMMEQPSETIARILRPCNIRVAHKSRFTLRRLLTNVKGKNKPEDRPGAVYKIKCSDYQATVGETGRNLATRLNEHKRVTKARFPYNRSRRYCRRRRRKTCFDAKIFFERC